MTGTASRKQRAAFVFCRTKIVCNSESMEKYPCLGLRIALILIGFLPISSALSAQDIESTVRQAASRVYEAGISREIRASRLDEFEVQCKSLLQAHEDPSEQAIICREVLRVYVQTGLLKPQRAIEYARRTLTVLADPVERLRVYCAWGRAVQTKWGPVSGRDLAALRKQALQPYLIGLKEAAGFDLPARRPELPLFVVYNSDGPEDSPTNQRIKKLKDEQDKERRRILFQQNMIDQRDVLMAQIVLLYSRFPFATEELLKEATEVLPNPGIADTLVSKVQEQIAERLKKEYPSPIPDAKTLGEDRTP